MDYWLPSPFFLFQVLGFGFWELLSLGFPGFFLAGAFGNTTLIFATLSSGNCLLHLGQDKMGNTLESISGLHGKNVKITRNSGELEIEKLGRKLIEVRNENEEGLDSLDRMINKIRTLRSIEENKSEIMKDYIRELNHLCNLADRFKS